MWILTLIFGFMLIGAIYFLLDQTGKERAQARQEAWERNKRLTQKTKKDPDVWPVAKHDFTDSDSPD